jgi:hypothetical protein
MWQQPTGKIITVDRFVLNDKLVKECLSELS